MTLARAGHLDAATTTLEHILALIPDQPDALQLLGMVARQRGDNCRAASLFRHSLSVEPGQPHVCNNLGNTLRDLGEHEAASDAYRRALFLKPEYSDARMNLALAQIALGRPDEAQDTLQPLIEAEPVNARAWAALGQAFSATHDNSRTIEAYRNALRLRPGHVPWEHNLAVALRLTGRAEEALPILLECSLASPGEAKIHYNMGHCLQDLGRFGDAAEAYRRALELTPDDAAIHVSLSRLLWKQGQGKSHLDSYRAALANRPDHPQLLTAFANELTLSAQPDDAVSLLTAAVARGVASAELHYRLGQARWSSGRPDDAFAAYDAALAIQDNHAPSLRESARCLIICNRLGAAAVRIARLLHADSTDQQALALQALVWRLNEDPRARWLVDPSLIGTMQLMSETGDTVAFNRDLDDALNPLHSGRLPPLEQTLSGGTQTTDDLFSRDLPQVATVRAMIGKAVGRYVAALPEDPSHPFLSRKASGFAISGSWSVRLNSGGHHTNHIHPEGWISAVYYVAVPDAVASGQSGWLKFGETGLQLGNREQIMQKVRPRPGLLVLFPSYFYHGTIPFTDSAHRTTIAFDVVPQGSAHSP